MFVMIYFQCFSSKMKNILPQQLFPLRHLPPGYLILRVPEPTKPVGFQSHSLSLQITTPRLWPVSLPESSKYLCSPSSLCFELPFLGSGILWFWEAWWNCLWIINTVRLQEHKNQGKADGLALLQKYHVKQVRQHFFSPWWSVHSWNTQSCFPKSSSSQGQIKQNVTLSKFRSVRQKPFADVLSKVW